RVPAPLGPDRGRGPVARQHDREGWCRQAGPAPSGGLHPGPVHEGRHRHGLTSSFTTRAGLPATTTSGGTSRVTTAPAPTTDRSPIVTPFSTTALSPIHTSSPIVTGRTPSGGVGSPARRLSASTGWPS